MKFTKAEINKYMKLYKTKPLERVNDYEFILSERYNVTIRDVRKYFNAMLFNEHNSQIIEENKESE